MYLILNFVGHPKCKHLLLGHLLFFPPKVESFLDLSSYKTQYNTGPWKVSHRSYFFNVERSSSYSQKKFGKGSLVRFFGGSETLIVVNRKNALHIRSSGDVLVNSHSHLEFQSHFMFCNEIQEL